MIHTSSLIDNRLHDFIEVLVSWSGVEFLSKRVHNAFDLHDAFQPLKLHRSDLCICTEECVDGTNCSVCLGDLIDKLGLSRGELPELSHREKITITTLISGWAVQH